MQTQQEQKIITPQLLKPITKKERMANAENKAKSLKIQFPNGYDKPKCFKKGNQYQLKEG